MPSFIILLILALVRDNFRRVQFAVVEGESLLDHQLLRPSYLLPVLRLLPHSKSVHPISKLVEVNISEILHKASSCLCIFIISLDLCDTLMSITFIMKL
jgi:hypothetical protein